MVDAIALAAWLAVAGAAGGLAVDTSVRVAAETRRTVPDVKPATTVAEAELAPRLSLSRPGRLHLSLRYEPHVRAPLDLSGDATRPGDWTFTGRGATVVHDAELAGHRRMGTGNWAVGASARGSYGDLDPFERERGLAQPVATTRRIPYAYGMATVDVAVEPSRREAWSFQLGSFLTGGADDEARAVLPLQRSVWIDSTFTWGVTPRDALSAVASVAGSRVERAGDAAYLLAGGGWRHHVRPTLKLRGAAGLAATFARAPEGGGARGAVPWARASLAHEPEAPRPSAEVHLAVAPWIDRVTGAIDARATSDAWVRWRRTPAWLLEAHLSFAAIRGWGGLDTFTRGGGPYAAIGMGELRASHELRPRLSVSAGVRAAAQRSDRVDLPGFREVAGFVDLVAGAAPRLRR